MKKQIPVIISVVLAISLLACGAFLLCMRNENNSLQQQSEQQTAEIQTLREKAEASAAQVESLTADVAKQEAEIVALNAEIADKTAEMDALTADAADKAEEINALVAAIAGKTTQVDALAADMAGKTTEIDNLNADMAGKASTIAALTAQIDVLQADLAEREASLEAMNASLAESAAQVEALNADAAEKAETIRALQEKTELQSADLTAREQEISGLHTELSQKAADLEAMAAEAAEKASQISQLQGIIHDSAAVAQRNALFDQLTAAGITPCVEIAEPQMFSAEQTDSDGIYILTQEYTWESAWSYYWALSFRNVSGETKAFRFQVVLYDAAGNVIGIKNPHFDCLADGYEGMVYISNEEPFDHVSFAVTVEESRSQPVQPFVEVTAQKSGNKAIITARNNGETAAKYVEYTALFLKGNQAVDSAWGYLTDSDNEIKPGKTELREEIRYPDFDSVVIYFEGRQ